MGAIKSFLDRNFHFWASDRGERDGQPPWVEGHASCHRRKMVDKHGEEHESSDFFANLEWSVGPAATLDWFEVGTSIGGENNGIGLRLIIPNICSVYAKVGIPRKLTDSWVYQSRDTAIKFGYIGHLLDVEILRDDDMQSMRSYYLGKKNCARCGHEANRHVEVDRGKNAPGSEGPGPGPCVGKWFGESDLCEVRCQTYVPGGKPEQNVFILHPGWEFSIPSPVAKLVDRALGQRTYEEIPKGEWFDVEIPMPEGSYTIQGRRTITNRGRARIPWPLKVEKWIELKADFKSAPQHQGKGESSWDLDDDAILGMHSRGWSVGEAVGAYVGKTLRQREKHGTPEHQRAA